MAPVTFSFRWNGILQCKKLVIEGLDIDTDEDVWKWKRPSIMTAQFEYTIEGTEKKCTTLETSYAMIANTIVLGLIHNDKEVATIILTIDEDADEIVCRVGKFTHVGEFNEMYYEEPELEQREGERRVRIVFGVDVFPEDLFEECC